MPFRLPFGLSTFPLRGRRTDFALGGGFRGSPQKDFKDAPASLSANLYGIAPVSAALAASRRKPLRIYVQEAIQNIRVHELVKVARQKNIPVHSVHKRILDGMSLDRAHQGIILEATKLDYLKMPSVDFIKSLKTTKVPLVLFLDEVTDPQNLGGIIRTAYFVGVDLITVSRDSSAPLSPVVSKASCGASEFLDIYILSKPTDSLQHLRDSGWDIIGTDLPRPDTVPVSEIQMQKPTVVVMGSEGTGLRKSIRGICSKIATIPSSNSSINSEYVDSLNVSVAAGITLHQLVSSRAKIQDNALN